MAVARDWAWKPSGREKDPDFEPGCSWHSWWLENTSHAKESRFQPRRKPWGWLEAWWALTGQEIVRVPVLIGFDLPATGREPLPP